MKYQENFIQGNFSKGRSITPTGLVLHHNDLSKEDLIRQMTERDSFINSKGLEVPPASYHCAGWKDGTRTVFCKDKQRAWHAGKSELFGRKSCNNFTMSYSFHCNTNAEPLTFNQIESFVEWFIPKKEKWDWMRKMIVDHKYVSPGRKVDLNPKELKRIQTAIRHLWW
jgi:N-acetyl-anhydromuramyl-L-alanine amidase AmpD